MYIRYINIYLYISYFHLGNCGERSWSCLSVSLPLQPAMKIAVQRMECKSKNEKKKNTLLHSGSSHRLFLQNENNKIP